MANYSVGSKLMGSSAAAMGRRALLLGLGASAVASRNFDLTAGSVPKVQLPQSSKPKPAPTPVPTPVGQSYIDPQKYYRPEHGDDWRPALQAAFTAGASQNKEVILDKAIYKCRQKPQPSYFPYQDYFDFSLFAVDASIRIRSVVSTGSRIVRVATDGSQFDQYDYTEVPGGYKARGGGLWMKSSSTTFLEDPNLRSFSCHGVLFDGQLRRSMGLTFGDNILDKGFAQQNDRNGGNVTFTGTATAPCGFVGWAGEQVYTSAINGTEASRRTLTINDFCEFGDTGGSALNPNGITLNVGACLLRDAFIGIEGWTGRNGGFINATFRDCLQSNVQAGTFNTDPARGGYYKYTQPFAGEMALGYLGITLIRSQFLLGTGMRGKVTAIDSYLTLGGLAFVDGVEDIDVELVSRLDTAGPNPALWMIGAGVPLKDTTARISLERTAAAEAAGRYFLFAVGWYGALGTGNAAEVRTNGLALANPPYEPFSVYTGMEPMVTVL